MSEIDLGAAPLTTNEPRWFISAPPATNLLPLLDQLRARGISPYLLSDVAHLGGSVLQNLRDAIVTADRVLVILTSDPTASANCAFEAGVAAGLGKLPTIVADPLSKVPPDLSEFLIVRAKPDDLDAIFFALDESEGKVAVWLGASRPTSGAIGQREVDVLRQQFDALLQVTPRPSERSILELLTQALEVSGAVVAEGTTKRRFDLGVWSDDLSTIGANPLLIELKRSLRAKEVHNVQAALDATPGANAALIVFLESATAGALAALREAPGAVLAISFDDLLALLRDSSFAEVVRRLRNRAVHGAGL